MSEDLLKVKSILKARGCSNRTINNYLSSLNRFKNYFKGQDVSKFNEDKILEYLKINFIDLGMAPATINLNRAAIKYYYLVNFNKKFNDTLLPYCKTVSKFPPILSKKDILYLIKSTKNLMHKIWLCLGFGSGLRVSEVASLKICDFSYRLRKIKIYGKGGKERYVPFPSYTHDLLLKYYKLNKDKIIASSGYLFPKVHKDSSSNHIHDETIKSFFYKIKKKYNLDKGMSFHTLRHSFATEFIKNGGDLWKLKDILGHSSINTTTVYLHMAESFNEIHSPLDGDI